MSTQMLKNKPHMSMQMLNTKLRNFVKENKQANNVKINQQKFDIENIQISFFTSLTNVSHPEKISFKDIIYQVKKTDRYDLKPFRDTQEFKERKNKLPQFTPHGTFTYRNNDSLVQHSQVLAFDIDLKDNPEFDYYLVKQALRSFPEIFFAYESPSGGMKFFALLTGLTKDSHNQAYKRAIKRYENAFNVKLDTHQGTLSQPCAIHHDSRAYTNYNAIPLSVDKLPQLPKQQEYNGSASSPVTEPELKAITESLTRKTLIVDELDLWVKWGYACALWGEQGRNLFHLVSKSSIKYNSKQTDQQFNHALRNSHKGKIGKSFIYSQLKDNEVSVDYQFIRTLTYDFTYKIDKYVSEKSEDISGMLEKQNLIISAPTGSGKSYLFYNCLAKNKRVLIAAPLKSIVKNIESQSSEIYGMYEGQNLFQATNSKVCACTYEQVPKLANHFDIIVIDEAHHLLTDAYKQMTINKLLLNVENQRIVFVSATLHPIFDIVAQQYDCKKVKFEQEAKDKKVAVKTSKKHPSEIALHEIIKFVENKNNKKKKLLIKHNSMDTLELIHNTAIKNKLVKAKEIGIYSSEKDQHEDFLATQQKLPCKILLTTDKLTDGSNLYDHFDCVLIEKRNNDIEQAIQFFGRNRKNTGSYTWYVVDKKSYLSDSTDNAKGLLNEAFTESQIMNRKNEGRGTIRLDYLEKSHLFFDDATDMWHVSKFKILQDVRQAELRSYSIKDTLRVKYPGWNFEHGQKETINQDTKMERKKLTEERAKEREQAHEFFTKNIEACLYVILILTKEKKLQKRLQKISPKATDTFYSENEEVIKKYFKHLEKLSWFFCLFLDKNHPEYILTEYKESKYNKILKQIDTLYIIHHSTTYREKRKQKIYLSLMNEFKDRELCKEQIKYIVKKVSGKYQGGLKSRQQINNFIKDMLVVEGTKVLGYVQEEDAHSRLTGNTDKEKVTEIRKYFMPYNNDFENSLIFGAELA